MGSQWWCRLLAVCCGIRLGGFRVLQILDLDCGWCGVIWEFGLLVC